jgi:hypothetical protein
MEAHMTDHYPAPDEDSGKVYGNAGPGRPEAWPSASLPDPVPSAVTADQGRAALSAVATPVSANAPYVPVTRDQSPPKLYAHKNEILYAFGGLFFPGLVLLLMGNKKLGTIMLCCWLASIALSIVLIGIPLLVGIYIWSVVACFREARRQNEAHGFVS